MTAEPIRIFVAMPGTTMGEHAKWADIEEIKENLLDPAARQIGRRLGRETELVIEKDKLRAGMIHPSMYGEAVDSDIYIADLSGANPNVYLELGVRWALRNGVTIPIAQDIKEDVKFNVSGVRVFQYGPMPDELKRAVREIVTAAVEGLRGPHKVDSPVRSSLELTTLPQAELDALIAENNRLKETLGDDLVAAARKSSPAEAISLLRQAISRNPVNSQARYELGVALRKAADYPGAIAELREAVRLRDDWAEAWRELGVALNKDGKLGDADQAFRRAVELNPDDAETWSTLGGLRRRLARSSAGSFDWEMLRESRDAYHRASQLLGNDTYSLVNEARVNLLLSAEDPSTRAAALAQLRDLEDLARYEARSGDPWKVFDLTDTYLLTGRAEDGLTRLRSAIESIDPSQRKSYLTSYIDPLRDFLAVGVLDEDADKGVRQAIGICEKAIEAARQLTP